MAKAINLIGGLKGRIGNVVYSSVKGNTIARVYQPVVANPNTYRQQISRAKFSVGGKLAKGLLRYITAGFNNGYSGREFQQAVKAMVKEENSIVTATSPDEVEINYSLAWKALSLDQMPLFCSFSAPDFETEGKCEIDLTDVDTMGIEAEVGRLANMGLVVVCYQPDLRMSVVFSGDMQSIVETLHSKVSINLPNLWTGMRVHVYAMNKVIPTSHNGVASSRQPWMYPSKTSQSYYVGVGDAS